MNIYEMTCVTGGALSANNESYVPFILKSRTCMLSVNFLATSKEEAMSSWYHTKKFAERTQTREFSYKRDKYYVKYL